MKRVIGQYRLGIALRLIVLMLLKVIVKVDGMSMKATYGVCQQCYDTMGSLCGVVRKPK
jgi:hypothetical protein